MAEFNVQISQEQLERIRRDIVKAFTPKETPVTKHPETTTEWLEDIALELHAITGLLNERLPRPMTVHTEIAARNLEAFKHEASKPMREHGECCDDPDEALALDLYGAWLSIPPDSRTMEWPSDQIHAAWLAVARTAREHITDWRAGEVERLLAANRDLTNRAETAEAERDELRGACNSWQSVAQEAEYLSEKFRDERDEWESKFEQADNLLSRTRRERDEWETAAVAARTQQRTAIAERDEWKGKAKRLNAMLSRTRDERDKCTSRAERWEDRHAALRNDVAACRNACQIEDILARDDERGQS